MSEMVDRVAKCIWAHEFSPIPPALALETIEANWHQFAPELLAKYRERGRAAMRAMREPTPAMMAGADAAMPVGFLWGIKGGDLVGCRVIWKIMIDEALK